MKAVERSPVMLLQVWRMSCQHDGSKIEIHPLLGMDSEGATCPGLPLSLYPTSAIPAWHLMFFCVVKPRSFLPLIVSLRRRIIVWERNWRAISSDSEGRRLPVQDLHSVKKSCFDISFTAIEFNSIAVKDNEDNVKKVQ